MVAPQLLTIEQTQRRLNISRQKLYTWFKDPKIPLAPIYLHGSLPRVREDVLADFIEQAPDRKTLTEPQYDMTTFNALNSAGAEAALSQFGPAKQR